MSGSLGQDPPTGHEPPVIDPNALLIILMFVVAAGLAVLGGFFPSVAIGVDVGVAVFLLFWTIVRR